MVLTSATQPTMQTDVAITMTASRHLGRCMFSSSGGSGAAIV